MDNWKQATWKDQKGRTILIHTMSDKWLNNIRKYFKDQEVKPSGYQAVLDEIKRRKDIHSKFNSAKDEAIRRVKKDMPNHN